MASSEGADVHCMLDKHPQQGISDGAKTLLPIAAPRPFRQGDTAPANRSNASAWTRQRFSVHRYAHGKRLHCSLVGARQLRIARHGCLIETAAA